MSVLWDNRISLWFVDSHSPSVAVVDVGDEAEDEHHQGDKYHRYYILNLILVVPVFNPFIGLDNSQRNVGPTLNHGDLLSFRGKYRVVVVLVDFGDHLAHLVESLIVFTLRTVFRQAMTEVEENRHMGKVQVQHCVFGELLVVVLIHVLALDVAAQVLDGVR